MSRVVGGLCFGVLVVAAGMSLPRAGQPARNPLAGDAAAIEEGRELLAAVCGGYCHSTTEGETTDAPDLFDCEWRHGDTDGDLLAVIREGVPDTRMQGFGGMLPDDDIWRVIAAIRADSRCADPEAAATVPSPAEVPGERQRSAGGLVGYGWPVSLP